jgi:hypothetical protein
MNDNRELFEVPGVYENARRQALTLALTVYVKCLKYMKDTHNSQRAEDPRSYMGRGLILHVI